MEVEIGKEGLKFENGAFTYYGVSALTLPSSGECRNCRHGRFCFFFPDLSNIQSLVLEWKWDIVIVVAHIKIIIESPKTCKPRSRAHSL